LILQRIYDKIMSAPKRRGHWHIREGSREKENTLSAFIAAGNRSYFGIETDVHVTRDNKFILIHDDTTGRVAEADVSVEDFFYDDLRKMNLKDIDDESFRIDLKMPNLKEYISICKKYEKIAVLELKNPMEENSVLGIIEQIKELEFLENVIFISFDYNNLVIIKEHYPNCKVQFLTMNTDDLMEKILAYKMDLDIWYKIVTKELVDECHKNGIEVNCWTVDDPEIAVKMIDYGVDYITSNILE